MKVELKRGKLAGWNPPGWATKQAKRALPFYKSRRGTYVHRVRSMNQYWRDGKLTHAGVDFWCGNHGFVGEKGILKANVEEGDVLCATCEGRAIGAGEDGARVINGRAVMYLPIRKAGE